MGEDRFVQFCTDLRSLDIYVTRLKWCEFLLLLYQHLMGH